MFNKIIKYECKEKAQEPEENANWYRCNQGENSTQTNKMVHKIPHICYSLYINLTKNLLVDQRIKKTGLLY